MAQESDKDVVVSPQRYADRDPSEILFEEIQAKAQEWLKHRDAITLEYGDPRAPSTTRFVVLKSPDMYLAVSESTNRTVTTHSHFDFGRDVSTPGKELSITYMFAEEFPTGKTGKRRSKQDNVQWHEGRLTTSTIPANCFHEMWTTDDTAVGS